MNEPDLPPYAGYDVLAKWETPSFDELTREVLAQRLSSLPEQSFLTPALFCVLEAVVARLAPILAGLEPERLARWIDDRLSRNIGEGFRREDEPPLQESWRIGLAALDHEAQGRFHATFVDLNVRAQDAVLETIQRGEVHHALWTPLDAATFFSDSLLKTIAGLSYAHPAAWNDIGFGGPAGPRGYVRLGFDARDPWEAKERRA